MNLVSHRILLSIQVIAVLLAMVQGHQRLFPTEVVHKRIPPAHGLTTNHAGASRSFILGLTYESTVPKSPKTPEESSSHLGLCHPELSWLYLSRPQKGPTDGRSTEEGILFQGCPERVTGRLSTAWPCSDIPQSEIQRLTLTRNLGH